MVAEKGVDGGRTKGERSCILVGVQIDGDGRELLGWVMKNLAEEEDRVVAVNVSRNDLSKNPAPSLIKVLNDCMAEHQDLCSMKKIVLVGRTSGGNSIKKVLVKEAENCAAKTLVVGANKSYSFGGSASLAKYCEKKLPSTIDLIAVHRGQVIFKRAVAKASQLSGGQNKHNLQNILHPSIGMDAKTVFSSSRAKSVKKNYCVLDYEKMRERNMSPVSLPAGELLDSKPGWPLLRRTVTTNFESLKEREARNMSVIHWVMSLPDRSLTVAGSQAELIKELDMIMEFSSSACKFFQYEELQNSTNSFSAENLIGKGGNSQVYMGCLPDGQKVAIKASKLSEESSRDFVLELQIITRIQHERIVPLIGICVENNNFYSIYAYFSRGSLQENLHGNIPRDPLNWEMRFKVAVGVAEALIYLHENCSRPVIHRDIKSSNILLSDEFNPQLSDFGLAIWAPKDVSHLTHSDVVGTFGYIAPEYFMYGKISSKVDVYAFGVVLLELLSGRKPIIDKGPKGQESLVMWAKPIIERGEIMELLDPNLNGKYQEEQVHRMALAASSCISRAAYRRPSMRQVLDLLQGNGGMKAWTRTHAGSDPVERDCQDEEVYPAARSIGEYLGLALLDVDDDASVISFEQNNTCSLDEYIRNRWSRSSSFD